VFSVLTRPATKVASAPPMAGRVPPLNTK
jgi:hypothetical protein